MTTQIPNIKNIKVDGVDSKDFPDFCDAFFSYAEYANSGMPLSDDALDALANNYPDVVNEMAHESFH